MHFRKRMPLDMAKRGRSGKRNKFVESSNSGALLYIKFVLIWATVLTLDFLLEFRFEYLWPCWLLLRSLHDSYRYQGVMFLFFFLCLGLTSDVILYLFVPVHWLFFLASTYVWVQFVWNSERGICIPTILLWILFVYVEFSVRLRQMRNAPFNIDLCRPFAAHSIGYPIVTLGFGFKTFVSYRYRLRKQQEVRQKNGFHFELLEKALGLPPPSEESQAQAVRPVANGIDEFPVKDPYLEQQQEEQEAALMKQFSQEAGTAEYCETRRDVNQFNQQQDEESSTACSKTSYKTMRKGLQGGGGGKEKVKKVNNADPCLQRLEMDVRRLRGDLQSSRSVEAELRSQLAIVQVAEKQAKMELSSVRQDNESLQNRLHNLVQRSQADKNSYQQLEKKLQEEKKVRLSAESALEREKRAKDELLATLCTVRQSAECNSDQCRGRKSQLESDLKAVRRDLRAKEESLRIKEAELRELAKAKEESKEREVLMTALNAMKEKNAVLDQALRDENKMKQDLLSALHKARRDMDYFQNLLQSKERELTELKAAMGPCDYWGSAHNGLGYAAGPTTPTSLFDSSLYSAAGLGAAFAELNGDSQRSPSQ